MASYVKTYMGHGIYRHFPSYKGGKFMYGDETRALYYSIAQYERAIDAHIAETENIRPAHIKYWDTLPATERDKWRRLCQTTELSAPELAYTSLAR